MKPRGKTPIWSPELAYAVGLITTDGNLSPDGRHMNLTSKDIEQIENFRTCLGLTNKVGRKARYNEKEKKYYVLQFGNVIFYKWLLSIGLTPKKSLTLKALKIPDEYFFHFLRGCLDGDGNILRYMDKVFPKSERLYVRFYCASMDHSQWMQKTIERLSNLKGKVREEQNENVLIYAKKESLKLLPLIYSDKNIPYLTRKYNLIESFL